MAQTPAVQSYALDGMRRSQCRRAWVTLCKKGRIGARSDPSEVAPQFMWSHLPHQSHNLARRVLCHRPMQSAPFRKIPKLGSLPEIWLRKVNQSFLPSNLNGQKAISKAKLIVIKPRLLFRGNLAQQQTVAIASRLLKNEWKIMPLGPRNTITIKGHCAQSVVRHMPQDNLKQPQVPERSV